MNKTVNNFFFYNMEDMSQFLLFRFMRSLRHCQANCLGGYRGILFNIT